MKNFLKGLFLGLALCTGLGIFSAYATRDNALRQEAKQIYQVIQRNRRAKDSKAVWDFRTKNEAEDYDYTYTEEFPACLEEINCLLDKNCLASKIFVLAFSSGVAYKAESDFMIRNLDEFIFRGKNHEPFLSYYATFKDTGSFVKAGHRFLLLVNDDLKEFMKDKDPDWNPEVFKLSEI